MFSKTLSKIFMKITNHIPTHHFIVVCRLNKEDFIVFNKEYFKMFADGVKDLFGFDNTDHISEVGKVPDLTVRPPSKEDSGTLSSRYDEWSQKKNAEYFRDQCPIYTSFLFQNISDCAEAFDPAVAQFFATHGNWRIFWSFPEAHITYLVVNTYHILSPWDKRDAETKPALLNELRRAYVAYAHTKGFQLEGLYNVLVTNLWLINNTLVLEIPNSEFSVRYPHLCRVLVPDNYVKLYRELCKKTIL